jgi:hypothetical protein
VTGVQTCALPILACWGDNSAGQSTPPAGTFTQVSAGYAHTCGLQSDGALACWGDNSYGQSTPPAGTFTQVSSGDYHTCGLQSDGALVCWGDNSYGQANTFSVSGNAGVAGTLLSYTDGAPKTATADAGGNYSFHVPYNWTGTVTPSKTGATFTPTSRSYINVIADQNVQNYAAKFTTATYLIYLPLVTR